LLSNKSKRRVWEQNWRAKSRRKGPSQLLWRPPGLQFEIAHDRVPYRTQAAADAAEAIAQGAAWPRSTTFRRAEKARSPEKVIDRAAFCAIAEAVGTKGVPFTRFATFARLRRGSNKGLLPIMRAGLADRRKGVFLYDRLTV